MAEPKTIIVVQARMGSTRLPGKSLLLLKDGITLVEMVLMRMKKVARAAEVVLATSRDPKCDPLEEKARAVGCDVVRGDENNVLSRFVEACERHGPEAVVRVCADNPFVSPEEAGKLVKYFYDGGFEYAWNNSPDSGLPDGFGAEIVRARLLTDVAGKADDATKEHVTQFILDNPGKYRTGLLRADENLRRPEIKLDVDTLQDYNEVKKICEELPSENAPFWTCEEIIKTYRRIFKNG